MASATQSELDSYDAFKSSISSSTGDVSTVDQSQPVINEHSVPESLTPKTDAALGFDNGKLDYDSFKNQVVSGRNSPPTGVSATPALSFQDRNLALGPDGQPLKLSIDEGFFNDAPLGDVFKRGAIAVETTPQKKLEVLQKLYPDNKSRILDNGEIAIQVTDSNTGKPKEVMLNPAGLNSQDLLDLAVNVPAIAASMATAFATQGTGMVKTIGQIMMSSFMGASVGGFEKAAARGIAGVPVDPAGIIKEQRGAMALDMLAQGGFAGAAKALRILSPLANARGPLEFDQQAAGKYLQDVTGIDVLSKLTPGQRTGSKLLQRIEAAETPQPGASSVLEKVKTRMENAVRDAIKIASGKVPDIEDVGADAIGALKRGVVQPLEDAVSSAREELLAKGNQRVLDRFDDAIGLSSAGGRVTTTEAGAAAREARSAAFKSAKAEVQKAYDVVDSLPGGKGDVIPGDAIAGEAAKIRASLPSVDKQTLESGVPSNLMKMLDDMESLKGKKVSLQTITNLKRAAYDEIARTEAVPGVQERWFSKVADAYESGLQSGIDLIGDSELKTALQNARQVYKDRIVPFERKGISDIQRGITEAGFKTEESLIQRIVSGVDAQSNYRVLKDAIKDSPEAWSKVKRSIVDTQIVDATDPITGRVNPDKLYNWMRQLEKDSPGIYDDLFGGPSKAKSISDTLLTMKSGLKSEVPIEDLQYLIRTDSFNKAAIEKLASAQKLRNEVFAKSIIQDVANGLPVTSKIRPMDFIESILSTKTPTKDVDLVLKAITAEDPAKREAISSALFYKVISEAETSAGQLASRKVNPKALTKIVGLDGSQERKRFELLLGEDTLKMIGGGTTSRADFIDNLAKFLTPLQNAEDQFRSVGGIAAGMAIQNIWGNLGQYGSRFAAKLLSAVTYTNPAVMKLISNTKFSPENTAVIANYLITAEPLVRNLVEIAGPDTAKEVVGQAKRWIDATLNRKLSPQEAELRKIQSGQPAKMKTSANY